MKIKKGKKYFKNPLTNRIACAIISQKRKAFDEVEFPFSPYHKGAYVLILNFLSLRDFGAYGDFLYAFFVFGGIKPLNRLLKIYLSTRKLRLRR